MPPLPGVIHPGKEDHDETNLIAVILLAIPGCLSKRRLRGVRRYCIGAEM
jgi:hypothetical protein